jgi:hypothetical protein
MDKLVHLDFSPSRNPVTIPVDVLLHHIRTVVLLREEPALPPGTAHGRQFVEVTAGSNIRVAWADDSGSWITRRVIGLVKKIVIVIPLQFRRLAALLAQAKIRRADIDGRVVNVDRIKVG